MGGVTICFTDEENEAPKASCPTNSNKDTSISALMKIKYLYLKLHLRILYARC